MSKDFNWKPYYIFIGIVSLICLIFNWKISIGLVIGSLIYFLKDILNQKKFPSLDLTSKALGSMLLVMFVQGLLILIAAIICWLVGKLYSFIACFIALIVPNIYFFIKSIKK